MNLLESAKSIPDGVKNLTEWLGDGGIVVDQEESQRRANICLHCDQNGEDWIVASLAADATRKYLELKNSLKLRVEGEKHLGRCKVCRCVLRLQVHEPMENVKRAMNHNQNEAYPPHCWKLQ